jgi:hypothetical protein
MFFINCIIIKWLLQIYKRKKIESYMYQLDLEIEVVGLYSIGKMSVKCHIEIVKCILEIQPRLES